MSEKVTLNIQYEINKLVDDYIEEEKIEKLFIMGHLYRVAFLGYLLCAEKKGLVEFKEVK